MWPELEFSNAWRHTFPGAAIGVLAMSGVSNGAAARRLEASPGLAKCIQNLAPARPYVDHFRHFRKTYPVLLQLESVAFKDRPLARKESMLTALFAAELDNLLLTAGYEREALRFPLVADVTKPDDEYIGIRSL